MKRTKAARKGQTEDEPMASKTKQAMFECMECGKKFYSVTAAKNAANNGCPKCNSCDIDEAY